MPDRSVHSKGYLMVESLVAIMIVTIGLLGIFALLSRSLSLNRVVADQFVAAYLAAEGIEIVKNIIDNDLLDGPPWNEKIIDGNYELDYKDDFLGGNERENEGKFLKLNQDPASIDYGAYGYDEPKPTNFKRTIKIIRPDDNEITVQSVVDWITRGGATFSVTLEDHFFNWR